MYGVKWSLTFFLLAQEEVETGERQFVEGWIIRSLTTFIFFNNSYFCQTLTVLSGQ